MRILNAMPFNLFRAVVVGTALVLTALLLLLGTVAEDIYEKIRGPIEGEAAVGQLKDDPNAYLATRLASSSFPTKVVWYVVLGLIVILWLVALLVVYFSAIYADSSIVSRFRSKDPFP